MKDTADRDAIKKYFTPFPRWAIWLSLVGLVVLAVGIRIHVGVVVIGIALIAVGIIIIWRESGVRPTDEQMDNYVSADVTRTKERSLAKASLDETELVVDDPEVIVVPRLVSTAGAEMQSKRGKDGVLRYTPLDITVLLMTQHQIIAYRCCMDMMTGSFLHEGTDEYFYEDVVSLQARTESITYETEKYGNLELKEAEMFMLTTSGGTSVKVVLSDPLLLEKMGGKGADIPNTGAEKAVQAVRRMLREKKMR